MNEAREKLIAAIDVSNAADARELIRALKGRVGAFKIGLQLYTAEGPDFVREVVEDGNRVFLDVKFHDIPNTVARASVEAAKLGVWMFNIHAAGGSEMMSAAVSAVEEHCRASGSRKPLMIGVTVLTSFTESAVAEIGFRGNLAETVVDLGRLARSSGLDGVVTSPREAALMRSSIDGGDFVIVTPGIRPADATLDDQKRVTSPRDAVRDGSDYLVVGRPITGSGDPGAAADAIVKEISGAYGTAA